MWHSSHGIRMGTKTPNKELPSATVLGFTAAEFHAGLSGDLFPLQLSRKNQHFQEQPRSAASGALQTLGGRSEEINATAPKWSDSHKLQLKKGCLDLSTQGILFRVSFLLLFWSFYELISSCLLSEIRFSSWGMWCKWKSRLTVPFLSSRNRRKYLMSVQGRGELLQLCTSQGNPGLRPRCLLLPTKALQGGMVQLRPQWEEAHDSKAVGKALFPIPLNKVFIFR